MDGSQHNNNMPAGGDAPGQGPPGAPGGPGGQPPPDFPWYPDLHPNQMNPYALNPFGLQAQMPQGFAAAQDMHHHQQQQQQQHQYGLPMVEAYLNGNQAIRSPRKRGRFSYTPAQMELLNAIYDNIQYPDQSQKLIIAQLAGITQNQMKIWFQNRRRKDVVGKTPEPKPKKYLDDATLRSLLQKLRDAAPRKRERATPYQAMTAKRRRQQRAGVVTSTSVPGGNTTSGHEVTQGSTQDPSTLERNSSGESHTSSGEASNGAGSHSTTTVSPDTTTLSDSGSEAGASALRRRSEAGSSRGGSSPGSSSEETASSSGEGDPGKPAQEDVTEDRSGADKLDMRGPPNKVATAAMMGELRARIKQDSESRAEIPPNAVAPPSEPLPAVIPDRVPHGPSLSVGVPHSAVSLRDGPTWQQQQQQPVHPSLGEYTHYSRDYPSLMAQAGYAYSAGFLSPAAAYPYPMVAEPQRVLSSLQAAYSPGPYPSGMDQPVSISQLANPFYSNKQDDSSGVNNQWPAHPYNLNPNT